MAGNDNIQKEETRRYMEIKKRNYCSPIKSQSVTPDGSQGKK